MTPRLGFTVREIKRPLEPVCPDPFIASLEAGAKLRCSQSQRERIAHCRHRATPSEPDGARGVDLAAERVEAQRTMPRDAEPIPAP
jgi:hypothetical protein